MASNIFTIARLLGATVVAELPDFGGGAFGAARLAGIVGELGGFAKRRVSRTGEVGELARPENPFTLPNITE